MLGARTKWHIAYHPYRPEPLLATFGADDWQLVTLRQPFGRCCSGLAARDVPRPPARMAGAPPEKRHQLGGLAVGAKHASDRGVRRLPTKHPRHDRAFEAYVYHRMRENPRKGRARSRARTRGRIVQGPRGQWALAQPRGSLARPMALVRRFERLPYPCSRAATAPRVGIGPRAASPQPGFTTEQSWHLLRA